MYRFTFLFAVIVALAVFGASEAKASPQLQVGCGVVKIAAMDPIVRPPAGEAHEHVFFGNQGVTANSNYRSLIRHKVTTCNKWYDTSSYWVPVVRHGDSVLQAKRLTSYYVNEGGPAIKPIPRGLKMVGKYADYRCGQAREVKSPPYGCTEPIRIRVYFPNCWNGKSRHPNSLRYAWNREACPPAFPYRIPTTRIAVHYDNPGALKSPLRISAGAGEWKDYKSMHGDIFHAGQQPKFDQMIHQCAIAGTNLNGCGGPHG